MIQPVHTRTPLNIHIKVHQQCHTLREHSKRVKELKRERDSEKSNELLIFMYTYIEKNSGSMRLYKISMLLMDMKKLFAITLLNRICISIPPKKNTIIQLCVRSLVCAPNDECVRVRENSRENDEIRRTVCIYICTGPTKDTHRANRTFSSQYSIVHRTVNTRVTIESTHAVIFALSPVFQQ